VYAATDKIGKSSTATQEVLVDSSEKLGQVTLSEGAVGEDVRELQQLLVDNKVYRYTPNGVYTYGVKAAVERFQRRLGQTVTGIADPKLIAALNGRIVVDQGECKLYFYLKGKLKFTFPVAVGQPAWPTPNGTWEVLVMAMNPTWIPPDSPWARGLEPIPPGAGNPLGTRWIGTSAPGVGIHGTPSSWSIGTHASHGCIRMYISDVETLYEYVQVGMPVIIRD
jgi:lipoprotein-anchoring transpeptidase ErfK/SrfK